MAKTTPRQQRDLNNPSSPNSPTLSPTPRRTSSILTSPPSRGPLVASAETSYHKRLRAILLDHKRCRREWNELVIRGCLSRTRAAIELWTDIEIAIKHVDSNKAGVSTQKTAVRAGYLFAQSAKLSTQLATISAVVVSLSELLATMEQLAERVEGLVVEAAKARGTAFAFRDPLWVTWPLSRFADGLQDLTSLYMPALTLIRTLLETLTTFPPLLSDAEEDKTASPAVERPKVEEIQAAMSLLAVQPLIPGKGGDGPEAWEETMAAEVGGWNDPR